MRRKKEPAYQSIQWLTENSDGPDRLHHVTAHYSDDELMAITISADDFCRMRASDISVLGNILAEIRYRISDYDD